VVTLLVEDAMGGLAGFGVGAVSTLLVLAASC